SQNPAVLNYPCHKIRPCYIIHSPGLTRPSEKFAGCGSWDPASPKTKRGCFWERTKGRASQRPGVWFLFAFSHACELECGAPLRGKLWGKGGQCERETRKQETGES
ncbi:unnamed protein product, partial [Ixodes persulcatus]